MSSTERIVKCIVTGKEQVLQPNYPENASEEEIRAVNEAAAAWYAEYLRGEVHFLSEEALDGGFRFHSTLSVGEQMGYRFLKNLGTDILCREARYFVNPADANDMRMTDNLFVGVKPKNMKDEIIRNRNADKPAFPQKS